MTDDILEAEAVAAEANPATSAENDPWGEKLKPYVASWSGNRCGRTSGDTTRYTRDLADIVVDVIKEEDGINIRLEDSPGLQRGRSPCVKIKYYLIDWSYKMRHGDEIARLRERIADLEAQVRERDERQD